MEMKIFFVFNPNKHTDFDVHHIRDTYMSRRHFQAPSKGDRLLIRVAK